MLKISSSIEYATRLMVLLARQESKEPVSAEFLAETENIPRDYVNQLLLRLRRSGLVASRRGAHGGYRLARAAEGISIGQIVEAVEEGVFQDVCSKYSTGETQCTHTDGCGIKPVWQRIAYMVEGFLSDLKLSELLKSESRVTSRIELLFASKDPPGGRSR